MNLGKLYKINWLGEGTVEIGRPSTKRRERMDGAINRTDDDNRFCQPRGVKF